MFNLIGASLTLLGVLVGIEALVDGLTLLLIGRMHPRGTPAIRGKVF